MSSTSLIAGSNTRRCFYCRMIEAGSKKSTAIWGHGAADELHSAVGGGVWHSRRDQSSRTRGREW